MANKRLFVQMIKEICEEKGIDYRILSYNWIIELIKDNKIRHITGFRFDLNPEAAGRIVCDKYGTYCILEANNIPCIKHQIVFNPSVRSKYISSEGIYKDVIDFFDKYKKIVVKPNYGSEGKNVFLCSSLKETEQAIKKIFETEPTLSLCPFYDIKIEYRAFVLNGKVKLIYGKEKPFIIGDGKSTMKELIENAKYVRLDNLLEKNLSYIPEYGEKIDVSWKYNLSGGATPKILENGKMYSDIEKLALDAARVANVKIASVDIIRDSNDNLLVLEINSGICGMKFARLIDDGYDRIKLLYSQAIDEMFK